MKKTLPRIYLCHTFYHVYITILKEFNLPKEEQGQADLILSSLSTNFSALKERIEKTGIFRKVFSFDEQRETSFPELAKYKIDRGSVKNMISRIQFTRKFAKFQEPYVPVDFSVYKDIYVYCDIDPIGIYLSQHHIYFHGVEDGYNAIADIPEVILDNPKNFKLKVFFSEVLNLIYLQNGFNKYCTSMEVNDISLMKYECRKLVEVPRAGLVKIIEKPEYKQLLLAAFVDDVAELETQMELLKSSPRSILLLTEHLCSEEVRTRIFTDLSDKYSKEGTVFIKPHPRDEMDYRKAIPGCNVFSRQIPMEIFNIIPDFHFDKVVGVFTPLTEITFADEKESLGAAFMDKYEAPEMHERFVGVR